MRRRPTLRQQLRLAGQAVALELVVPANVGHLRKRVFFASEVPDGKFKQVESEVHDDGSQTVF